MPIAISPARRFRARVVAVFLCCAAAIPCRAQTCPTQGASADSPPGAPAVTPAVSRATTRTIPAVLVAVDAERKTLRLRPMDSAAGSDMLVAIDPECEYTRKGAASALTAFAPGERVVARLSFRTSPQEVVILRELWDERSYLSERQTRTELCVGKIASGTPSAITVRRERDGTLVAFRVTEKTRILKYDKPAPLEAFPVGEKVVVKPRALPGGGVMAAIVGGTLAEVTSAHLDTLVRWEGVIHAVDPGAADGPTVTLLRNDGATRRVLLAPGASLKQGRKALSPATLPVGGAARVHLVRGGEKAGLRFADEITIVVRREAPGETR